MTGAPPNVQRLLDAISTHCPRALTGNLVGIYLYGSLTQDAFDPMTSDVDVIVVTQRELTDQQFRDLDTWFASMVDHNSWTNRLQITFLLKDHVLTMDAPACLYQFGKLSRCRSDGNPIIWMNVLESGEALYGPPAETFVPEITRDEIVRALVREVGYLREEICDKLDSEWRDVPKYRAYAVLTVCRILYTFEHGAVVSKPHAAEWVMKTLGHEWSGLISQALTYDGVNPSVDIPLRGIEDLIELTTVRIRA